MKKLKKMLVALLAATLMISALPLSASAAAIDNEATPWWTNTTKVACSIAFLDDGYGYADAQVIGKFGVTNVAVDVYVYCLVNGVWVYVTEQHDSAQAMSLISSCQFTPTSGCTYRADYTFTVTKNGVDQVITKITTKVCP
jgi:hypothetical protein